MIWMVIVGALLVIVPLVSALIPRPHPVSAFGGACVLLGIILLILSIGA
jgi:hypothetical protein